jgi:N-acetylmuramoyl-L-alanine amidase
MNNLSSFYNVNNKKLVIRSGAKQIVVTALNPFILIDDDVVQMPLSTEVLGEKIYVPLLYFINAIGKHLPGTFKLDIENRTIRVYSHDYNITGIGVEEKSNGFIIRLNTTKRFDESKISAWIKHDWLYVTLNGGTLDSTRLSSTNKKGLVEKIVPFQFDNSAQISFELDRKVVDPQVVTNDNEVLVTLRITERPIQTSTVIYPETNRKIWLIDKIIIDPGHGGRDPGAVGSRGTKEKDVNLSIAKRLKTLIEKNLKVEVLLTRETDKYVKLGQRTRFANANGGKLFISLHANANRKRTYRGYSTYILGMERANEALAVAEQENSVVEMYETEEDYKEFQNAAFILNAIAQSSYLRESQDLALMVNESMKEIRDIPQFGKGLYQHKFWGLVGAAMPRILIETAFISNQYEERLLKTKRMQQRIAKAIYEGIKKFKEKYEQEIG